MEKEKSREKRRKKRGKEEKERGMTIILLIWFLQLVSWLNHLSESNGN